MKAISIALSAAAISLASPVAAQFAPKPLAPLTMTAVSAQPVFTADHVGTFNGKRVRYRSEVAETIIADRDGKPAAHLFSYAYIAQTTVKAAARPVIFAFNGGPGGSSVFLHLGALGPKILPMALNPGDPIVPGNGLIDNPQSPLDVADLVFLDPVETGLSHLEPGADGRPFYSIDGDSEAMSRQVINWLTMHGRLDSPVYIYGESYGTMRAVAMGRDLARGAPALRVAGLLLGGNSLGYFQKGQMPDILFAANALPMMASVAWYHGAIDNKGQTWRQAVDKARAFAETDYVAALMQGYQLDDATRDAIVRKLPSIIGIREAYFRDKHTIVASDFLRELLRDRGLLVDGNDGRKTIPANAERSPPPFQRYADAFETYLRGPLGVADVKPYQPVNMALNPVWNYYTAGAMALDVTLSKLMLDAPAMRVMLVQGRYDTLTTLGNSEYIMRQANLDWHRYQIAYYDGGHSLIAQPEIMSAIRRFVGTSSPSASMKQASH